MTKKINIIILCFFLSGLFLYGQSETAEKEAPAFYREYPLVFTGNYGLDNAVTNSRTAVKLLFDAYYRGIGPLIGNQTVRNIGGFLWSFATTWSSTMWPHEFGHFLRTRQFGGDFRIVKVTFPIAFGEVSLPEDSTPEQELLFIIGGLETNFMIARDIQLDYYRYKGLYNDELFTAFFHRIMYPAYTFLFVPLNPYKTETWRDEQGNLIGYGDAACFTQMVWQRGGNSVILEDDTVAPGLSAFYMQAAIASLLWNLADFHLYQQAAAVARGELNGRSPRYLLGDEYRGWSYGTLFNASVLGAELYLHHYLRWNGKFYSAYQKYGFPFRNYGLGFSAFSLLPWDKINLDLNLEVWTQDFYGEGLYASANLDISFTESLRALMSLGWKSPGYVLGQPLESGLIWQIGVKYAAVPKNVKEAGP